MFVLTVEQIARVCHEANRAYCMSIGDHSQPTWDMAPQWQRESAIEGVRAALANPDRTPADIHEEWLALKKAQGWKHGPIKAPELKEHPCMLPRDELPEEQQAKDHLFLAIALALREHTFDQKKGEVMRNAAVPEGEGEMVADKPKGGAKRKPRKPKLDPDETPVPT